MTKLFFAITTLLLTTTQIVAADFEINGIYYNIIDNYNSYCEVTSGNQIYNGDISIPDEISFNDRKFKVIKIGDFAFMDSQITSITIPNNVVEIGASAFLVSNSLSKINLGTGLTKIGNDAFVECPILEEIILPDNVIEIGLSAFLGCRGLKAINIPINLTTISDRTFYGCSSLTEITLSDKTTTIGWSAFDGCTSLKSIVLPDNISKIGNNAFANCTSLESIKLPKSTQSMPYGIFENCSSLSSITIPQNITYIEQNSFIGCTNLIEINLPDSTIPPILDCDMTTDKKVFESSTIQTATLNICKGSFQTYKYANGWQNFSNIVEKYEHSNSDEVIVQTNLISISNHTLHINNSQQHTIYIYNTSGRQVYSGSDSEIKLSSGLYLVKIDNQTFKALI